MNYRNPELLDKLAGEYVLGTLRGLARKRFERLMEDSALARLQVTEWESRLNSLATITEEVKPPQWVWRVIESRIRSNSSAKARVAQVGRWGTAWWRGLALAMSGVAALLAVYVGMAPPSDTVAVRSYVVVLNNDKMKPVMLAEADPEKGEIRVRVLIGQQLGGRNSLELWGVPKAGQPRSYGLLPASGVVRLKMDKPMDQVLVDIAALAVSLEPPGGSPTGQPTGPVLYSGEVIRPI
ncbi:anti-sigma factor [Chitinivorax sp. B]|uniref:anti-sigma factor n=1 Tax=Chitinivorax sp. B TaxID=2502235 RepID=UPI0010F834C6|nr:anti-sigma factor [Chitinivorax sp. B]